MNLAEELLWKPLQWCAHCGWQQASKFYPSQKSICAPCRVKYKRERRAYLKGDDRKAFNEENLWTKEK